MALSWAAPHVAQERKHLPTQLCQDKCAGQCPLHERRVESGGHVPVAIAREVKGHSRTTWRKSAKSPGAQRQTAERRQPRRWSILTAEDHYWYLANQAEESLCGAARERMEALHSRVAVEQRNYLAEQWQRGISDRQRYNFLTPQAKRQMEADAAERRQRVMAYPRLYRLHALIKLPDQQAAAAECPLPMWHLQTLRSQPATKYFRCPQAHQPLLPPISRCQDAATAQHRAADGNGDHALPVGSIDALDAPACDAKTPIGQPKCEAERASAEHLSGWKLPAPELSADAVLIEVAEAAEGSIHAAITASAFTALMATLPTDQSSSWELPVQSIKLTAVPSSDVDGGSASEQTVLFDKPLQARVMNLRQKHERLYKAAFTALGTSCQKPDKVTVQHSAAHSALAEGSDLSAVADAALSSTGLPPAAAPRGAQYDMWRLGDYQLLVRSYETARSSPLQMGGSAGRLADRREFRPVIVRAKMEYIPKQGLEQVTVLEMARWRASMQLRPDSVLLLARVAAHEGSLLKLERLRMKDVLAMCEDIYSPQYGYQLIAKLVSFMLASVPEGRYMLVHPPGASVVMCFKALSKELQTAEMVGLPLPLEELGVSPSNVYDLHAAHSDSGATEDSSASYVPPTWKQFNEGVPQIPYTYPVRLKGAPKRRDSTSVIAIASDENRQRRRLRKLLPSAWNMLGVGGDWDSVDPDLMPRKDSLKEYAQSLE